MQILYFMYKTLHPYFHMWNIEKWIFLAGKSSFRCTYAWSWASKASDPEEPRGLGWGGMWGGLKDVLDTCVPEGWFSCKKYSLFYVSHMKIWVQSFVHEIQNLHFTFENLVVCFWSWYMAYGMSHIWMSVHTFSDKNMELCISHIGQFEHTFSCLKYGTLYIFHMEISIKNFWHEVCSQ